MSIDLRLLIKNGVHFGHQKSRWCPKMKPYIWGYKNDIYLIDVSKTAHQLERAAKFLETVASEGRTILLVGTKKAAYDGIMKVAKENNLPYVVHRWVGGTFSNFRQVRKAIANMLHYEDILAKSEQFHYNKKELSTLKKREGRLNNIVGGIRNLTWPVGAVVVVDVKKEHVAVKEAHAVGIPVVGIVDTNSDPDMVDYVIPANDDAPRSINVLMDYLGEAIHRGIEIAASRPKEQAPLAENFDMTYEPLTLMPEEEEEAKKPSAVRRTRKPVGPTRQGTSSRPRSSLQRTAKPRTPSEAGAEKSKEAPKASADSGTSAE